jgi:hypothetical protein
MPRATRAVSRKDFFRLSGAGLAGAALLGTTGCGGHATLVPFVGMGIYAHSLSSNMGPLEGDGKSNLHPLVARQ